MDIAGIQRHNQRKVGIDVDFFSVQRHNGVAGLNIGRKCAVFFHKTDLRKYIAFIWCQKYANHRNAGDKIHGGTGYKNDESLPPRGIGKSPGVFAVPVLSLHGAVTAYGNAADGIQCFSSLFLPERGPHKQGKLIYLNAEGLCRGKMSQLMDKNQEAEKDNRKNNAHRYASKN